MTTFQRRFIITEPDSFIARDLCEGLLEACPVSDAHHCRSLKEISSAASDAALNGRRPVIVTKASPDELDNMGITELAQKHGWPVVVRLGFHSADRVEARGWLSLPLPFTRDHLADLVARLDMQGPDLART